MIRISYHGVPAARERMTIYILTYTFTAVLTSAFSCAVAGCPDPATHPTEGLLLLQGDLRSGPWHGQETVPQRGGLYFHRCVDLGLFLDLGHDVEQHLV